MLLFIEPYQEEQEPMIQWYQAQMVVDEVPLTPDQKLVFFMLERAARDSHSPDENIKRDARVWLFNQSLAPLTAQWWAELAGLERCLHLFRRTWGTYRRLNPWRIRYLKESEPFRAAA